MSEWKSVFDANISLYVRIIVEHLLNNGWQMISINDYIRNMPSFSCMDALKTNDYQKEGLFPIVSQSKDLISGYTDNKQLVNKIDSPIIIFGDHTQVVKYIDFDFVLGADGTKILTVSKDYLPKFLYYIIKSIDLHSNKYARHYSKLRKEKIPYCKDSINIQEKIVAFLDSLAENAIEEKNYFDKIIESKIISLQKECLNICLIEKENEKQKSYAKQLRQNILQDVFTSHKGVEYCLIDKMLAKDRKGMMTGPFGTLISKIDHRASGIPMLGIENIGNGKFVEGNKIFLTPEKAKSLQNYKVFEGDIIISRSGTVGEICSVPLKYEGAIISTNLIKISLDKHIVYPEFFVLLFQSKGVVLDQVKNICVGSTRIFLTQTILKQVQFPLPPLAEQKEIVARVEQHLQTITQLETQIATRETTTKQLMQSILKDAFEER